MTHQKVTVHQLLHREHWGRTLIRISAKKLKTTSGSIKCEAEGLTASFSRGC